MTGLDAAKLAQQYINAHHGSQRAQPTKGNLGSSASGTDEPHVRPNVTKVQKVAPEKPSVQFCYVPREEDTNVNRKSKTQYIEVTVNGQTFNALLDSGSSLSLIKIDHTSHVSFANLVSVQCVHGDLNQYPQVEVNVHVQDQTYLLSVAVVDDLPADMILGRDFPVLLELLHFPTDCVTTSNLVSIACLVVTRAQNKAGLQPLPDLHHSLLQGRTKGPRKTHQRRLEKGLGTPAPEIQTDGLEVHGWKVP